LDLLAKQAEEHPEEYLVFWSKFGVVLKEGLYYEPDQKSKLESLLRYYSTGGEKLISLADYTKRMPLKQKAIYYAIGASRELLAHSPHLEGLKMRGYEALLMIDAIDQWAVEGLGEFESKPLRNIMQEGLDLDEVDKQDDKPKETVSEDKEKEKQEFGPFLAHCQKVLSDKVSEVRVSERLTDSPVCLVIPKGGLPTHLERFLRASQPNLPETKHILEINPKHPLIERIHQVFRAGTSHEQIAEWIELLYDQALLTEGSPIDDPIKFAGRVTRLLQLQVDSRAGGV
jgi:molecular chaperone HtpG